MKRYVAQLTGHKNHKWYTAEHSTLESLLHMISSSPEVPMFSVENGEYKFIGKIPLKLYKEVFGQSAWSAMKKIIGHLEDGSWLFYL